MLHFGGKTTKHFITSVSGYTLINQSEIIFILSVLHILLRALCQLRCVRYRINHPLCKYIALDLTQYWKSPFKIEIRTEAEKVSFTTQYEFRKDRMQFSVSTLLTYITAEPSEALASAIVSL